MIAMAEPEPITRLRLYKIAHSALFGGIASEIENRVPDIIQIRPLGGQNRPLGVKTGQDRGRQLRRPLGELSKLNRFLVEKRLGVL